jgi:Zn-dependent protease
VNILLQLPVLLFAVVFHECAHAYVALSRGDTTARDVGRLTLNPLPHLDPIGSVLVPLLLLVSQGLSPRFLVAWAKPVPIDLRLLRGGKGDLTAIAFAGPASNVLLAFGSSLALGFLYRIGLGPHLGAVHLMLQYGVAINCVLAVFNVLPVPPLDGANILLHFLPPNASRTYAAARPYALPVLLIVMLLGGGSVLLAPAYMATRVLLGMAALIAG